MIIFTYSIMSQEQSNSEASNGTPIHNAIRRLNNIVNNMFTNGILTIDPSDSINSSSGSAQSTMTDFERDQLRRIESDIESNRLRNQDRNREQELNQILNHEINQIRDRELPRERERAQRNIRYLNENIWRDHRHNIQNMLNEQNHSQETSQNILRDIPHVTIESSPNEVRITSHSRNHNRQFQTVVREISQPDNESNEIISSMYLDMERKHRSHIERINELNNLISEFAPDHLQLYRELITDTSNVRLSIEIDDPCYSCAFDNYMNGIFKICQLVDPKLWNEAKQTFRNNKPCFATAAFINRRGLLPESNIEVRNLIFDFDSIIQNAIGTSNRNVYIPIFIHVDGNGFICFDGIPICKTRQNKFPRSGSIYLKSISKNNHTQIMFDTEKEIKEFLIRELWYIVIDILRNKYRLLNSVDCVNIIKRKRSCSFDNLNDESLNNGLSENENEDVVIKYQQSPFRSQPRDIVIKHSKVDMKAKNICGTPMLKHKVIHKKVRKNDIRTDFRDKEDYSECVPYMKYRPTNISNYIINNGIEKVLSEDDTAFIEKNENEDIKDEL